MKKFKIQNINFNFVFEEPYDDILGLQLITISTKELIYLFTEQGWKEGEQFTDYCEYAERIDELLSEGEQYDEIEIDNADLQIVLYSWMNEDDNEYTIEARGENPFWFMHDTCHADSDVTSGSVYVDKYIEEERIIEGIKLAKSLGMELCVTGELIKSVQEGFEQRWNYRIDTNEMFQLLNN